MKSKNSSLYTSRDVICQRIFE